MKLMTFVNLQIYKIQTGFTVPLRCGCGGLSARVVYGWRTEGKRPFRKTHPLIPEITTPCVNIFWLKKKMIIGGSTITTDAAMIRCVFTE